MKIVRRTLKHPTVHGIAIGAVALTVYVRSLAPSVMWYDMGEFATAAYTLGIAHNTGYPLFMLLAKLFTFLPLGDPAYRVNLFSAVAAAATVALTYVFVYRLTSRKRLPFFPQRCSPSLPLSGATRRGPRSIPSTHCSRSRFCIGDSLRE